MPQPSRTLPADPVRAENLTPHVIERADAPESAATPYGLDEGRIFGGTIGFAGDRDAVAVRLQAGQTYEFLMVGNGANPVADTILSLRDADGNELRRNDDHGGQLDRSFFTFTARADGIHYLQAQAYGSATGGYALTFRQIDTPPDITPTPDSPWTMEQIAHYLTDGFWDDFGYSRHHYDVQAGGTLTVDVTALRPQARELAMMALDGWSQVTGIRFRPVADPSAHIMFDEVDDGRGAYSRVLSGAADIVTQSLVRIPAWWFDSPGEGFASYEYQTYVHEIGHALGLGHAGPYNGSGEYATDRIYANDSWQASVMSYFDQDQNTYIHASRAFAVTPMMADILAVQDLYGVPANLHAGNTVWGVGGNVGGAFGVAMRQMISGARITATIADLGGIDRIDCSSDTRAQLLDLHEGAVSNVYGLIGNLAIARGTIIENARAGSGSDRMIGNAAANHLWGGAGDDRIWAGAGNDTLDGGTGADRLVGDLGDDLFIVDARDIIVEAPGGGIDRVRAGFSCTLNDNLEALQLLVQSTAKYATGNAVANTLIGNASANIISGAAGNDTLMGLAGDDTLAGNMGVDRLGGGAGDDTYMIDAFDIIVEAANEGFDTVMTPDSVVLGANLERAVLTGSRDSAVTGNAGANVIEGNGGANLIAGGGGQDTMRGGGGADEFRFATGSGGRVLDFQDGLDRLVIATRAGATAGSVMASARDTAAGVGLLIGGTVLIVEDITLADLRDDILFI
ncbi:MAG TPA: M10 family metallopeptidase [Paracoccus sp. (in: a-proteobacteria)]|nr:M10 family metallopeptidase [Paracoccus sp. (in: a-proteobacteria)]